MFALAAIIGGLLTITSRNPVYSALWFAMVVIATSGLFLLAGASFLAAGTIIVYAGAIIVTFLFVIMLAQMEGRAIYDRAARAPGPATFACFLLFWCLIYTLSAVSSRSLDRSRQSRIGARGARRSLPRARELATVLSAGKNGTRSRRGRSPALPPTACSTANFKNRAEAPCRRTRRVALHRLTW